MKCFNHSDQEVVGVCRICGKALCKDCASSQQSIGVTCKGACEEKAKDLSGQLEKLQKVRGNLKNFFGYYSFFIGILIIATGLFLGMSGVIKYLIVFIGLCLTGYSLFLFRQNKKKG